MMLKRCNLLRRKCRVTARSIKQMPVLRTGGSVEMLALKRERERAELVMRSEGRLSDNRLEGMKNLKRQR
jgi:hypothetical protein